MKTGEMMIKEILVAFEIKKNDIITITGTGGKTSLMWALAYELKNYGRVLVTTSTKIGVPKNRKVDYFFDSFEKYELPKEDKAIVCMGEKVPGQEKIGSLKEDDLEFLKKDFDYILIEGDGSRNLPLKMWKDHEPVIYNLSTKVIGVFSAKILNEKVSPELIYNYEAFVDKIKGTVIDKDVISQLVSYDKGLFKGFSGDKMVFFNQVDNDGDKVKIEGVLSYIVARIDFEVDFVYGSVENQKYFTFN